MDAFKNQNDVEFVGERVCHTRRKNVGSGFRGLTTNRRAPSCPAPDLAADTDTESSVNAMLRDAPRHATQATKPRNQLSDQTTGCPTRTERTSAPLWKPDENSSSSSTAAAAAESHCSIAHCTSERTNERKAGQTRSEYQHLEEATASAGMNSRDLRTNAYDRIWLLSRVSESEVSESL